MDHNAAAGDALYNTRLNSRHLMVMFWCSLLMLFDGYDLVIYGSILPQLMHDWQLSPVTAGFIGTATSGGDFTAPRCPLGRCAARTSESSPWRSSGAP